MLPNILQVQLLSDTTCGSGEGMPGEVDVEIEHDSRGLPIIGGKTIHGLLRETWLTMSSCFPELRDAGCRVFGMPGSFDERTILHVGNAEIQRDVGKWVGQAIFGKSRPPIPPGIILRAFTGIRRQTAMSRVTGSPKEATLRASRVVLRGLTLDAPLTWILEHEAPKSLDAELKVLAMSVLGSRHIGLARNRGRGYVRLSLLEGCRDVTKELARLGGE